MPRINPLLVLLAIGGVIWFVMRRGIAAGTGVSITSITVPAGPLLRGTLYPVDTVVQSVTPLTIDYNATVTTTTGTLAYIGIAHIGVLLVVGANTLPADVLVPSAFPAGTYVVTMRIYTTGTTTVLAQGQQTFTVI